MPDWVNTDGTFGDMENAPEEVRTMVEAKEFTNVSDIVKMAIGLESMKGTFSDPEAMHLPDAFSDEQLTKIHGKLGVPEAGSDYKLADGETAEDQGLLDSFKEFAKSKNYTQNQFSETLAFYNSATGKAKETLEQFKTDSFDKGLASIKETWGDDYDKNATAADQISIDLGIGDHIADLGLSNDPKMVEMLFKIHQATEEGTLKLDGGTMEKTKAEQLEEIIKNPAFANNMDPEHPVLFARFQKIMGIAG